MGGIKEMLAGPPHEENPGLSIVMYERSLQGVEYLALVSTDMCFVGLPLVGATGRRIDP